MKQRIFLLITVFFYFIILFISGKIIFLLSHFSAGGDLIYKDALDVVWHGLPLDMSMSGYLTVIPALILIISIWLKPKVVAGVCNVYFGVIFLFIGIVTIVDIIVYPYWGFHFDSTVFLYLQNPKESFASASVLDFIFGFLGIAVYVVIAYLGYIFIIRRQVLSLNVPKSILKTSIVLVLLTASLFLPIRGGVTVSTMNVGQVYYSDNMFLNHAAINPEFNLMVSFFKSDDFASQYQFYDKEKALDIFNNLNNQANQDSVPRYLKTNKPNIILFILESFSASAALDSLVAPHMSGFAKEGIFFDNFYANSFRTDRGLVSILSGYPAHPTVAIMKYPHKTESLPTIPKFLKKNGYDNLSFYYGGDADFANMRSYFVGACGIKDVISDKDFPLSDRMTKWGVPDKILIDRVYNDLTTKEQATPYFKTVLTLSSHEPFDVPEGKFDAPFLNAVNYTDACLGNFVSRLKATDQWDNTLIIFVADHAMQSYPPGLNNSDPKRFRIPMIWIGGAIKNPAVISDYGSQNDLAATLFSQLDVKQSDFKFSKDLLNPDGNKFAFYSYVNGFCMIDSTGSVIYDNDKEATTYEAGDLNMGEKAKSFFQMMYLDLGNR